MARSTKEWVGKDDDTPIPPRVKLRVKSRANDCCQICGIRVRYGGQIDHIEAVKFSSETRPLNRESNLRFLCKNCHRAKTNDDVAQKSREAKTQIRMAGFNKPKRPFPYQKKERSTLPLRVAWIDEQGRDRVTWLKPTT